ncbi:hypothetical protein M8J77_001985 [Diaphorina citri]|nr:hypothetical protein M8J77_001985 [Diaphorina citri]
MHDSLIIHGKVNQRDCDILLDTGASKSILRRDFLVEKTLKNPDKYALKTATGEQARAYGEIEVDIQLGDFEWRHTFIVADIIDECILGCDFILQHRVYMNFWDMTMVIENVEVPVTVGSTDSCNALRILINENVTLPPLSESIVWARVCDLPANPKCFIVEPEFINPDVLPARTLVTVADQNVIPVRVMNTSTNKVRLKENDILGNCEPVMEVVTIDGVTQRPSFDRVERPGLTKELLKDCKLEPKDRKKAAALISEFSDVFSLSDDDCGRTGLVKHRIDTGDSRPIRQPPRRLALAKQDEVQTMINNMKKQGVIEESTSPWSSPVVLVKKKDGNTRFCVDYRRLNDVTRKDSYPLPRIDDTLDTLSGAEWFSTLDLKSGYWQVELHPEDKEKTAFSVGSGLWHFNVLPFGLCNAPATFERLMDCILRGLTWKTCLVYLDDIIVIGKTFQEQLDNLRAVFIRLRNAHLKLSPKKCNLFRTEVQYLGHVVSTEGVSTDPKKIEAVKSWPIPKDKHEVRSFLGLVSYYRRFIKGFADIARSLHRLTEKGKAFVWTEECNLSFETLKSELCKAPILRYPVAGKPFVLDTDASQFAIGAVLSQVTDGIETPVAYFSKALSKPERNYCVTRKELLAVVSATKHFHKYLYGQRFLLRTDHAALKWLLNFKNPEGQVARWIELLQNYDFEIQHRSGKAHGNADALSRRPCNLDCKHCTRMEDKQIVTDVRLISVEPEPGWTNDELRKEQLEDDDISPVLTWKEREEKPRWKDISDKSEVTKSYLTQWDSLILESGVLKRKWESQNGRSSRLQIVLPHTRVKEVLEEFHGGVTGGHLGINKTLDKLRERFYWLHMKQDVEDWIRRCSNCAGSKGPRTRSRGELQKYVVGAPFERIAMDVAGPFPETNNGNRYILVIMDYFSKWPEAFAIPNQEATTVADCLINHWVSRFGVPLELHSDQGRNFESQVFQEICSVLGIKKTRTTPLHPQSDGMVERFNRTLLEHLRKVVDDHQREWDKHIPLFLLAYRSATHNSTGQSPALIIFGKEMRLPSELRFGSPPSDDTIEINGYVADLRQELREIHDRTRDKLNLSSDRMKTRYDLSYVLPPGPLPQAAQSPAYVEEISPPLPPVEEEPPPPVMDRRATLVEPGEVVLPPSDVDESDFGEYEEELDEEEEEAEMSQSDVEPTQESTLVTYEYSPVDSEQEEEGEVSDNNSAPINDKWASGASRPTVEFNSEDEEILEQTGSEVEYSDNEPEPVKPTVQTSRHGGPKSADDYLMADITNEQDWEIRDQLDAADTLYNASESSF